MNNKKYFYVYYSYEPWGRGYIGKRECECLPEEDVKYFGSYRDKTFKPTEKIVLQTFDTVEEVLQAEILLHEFYEVDKNPHFANKVRATTTGFYYSASGKDNPFYGRKHKKETIERIVSKNKGRKQDRSVVERRTKSALKYKYLFISPDNQRYEVDSANEFCIANNLNSSAASQVARGNWSNHQGWKVVRISKNLDFTEEIIREHLKRLEWVDRTNGEKMIGRKDTEETKKKKSIASKGKKKSKESIEKRTDNFCKYIWTFISPEGIVYESYNCNELCRELNLCQVGIGRVARGVRPHYRGWKVTRRPRNKDDK
jgi:hypothetical protein